MPEFGRLIGGSDCFELGFVEREATPESAMKLAIRLHLAGLSLSDTVTILEELGVDRCRTTVHDWVQKADLQPLNGANPDHVAVDETVIQLNAEQYWLYAGVDPATNRLLHARLYPAITTAVSSMFLAELREKHRSMMQSFSSTGRHGCRRCVTVMDYDSSMKPRGIGIAWNASSVKSNAEPTSSQTVSAMPQLRPSKTGCERSPSHGISLSGHSQTLLLFSVSPSRARAIRSEAFLSFGLNCFVESDDGVGVTV